MNEQLKKKIFLDLAEKYPAGPRGNLKKGDYTLEYRWVSAYDRFTNVVTLSGSRATSRRLNSDWSAYFGYDPVQLFKLRLRTEDACKSFASKHFGGKAAARRGRLVWIRIQDAVSKVRTEGTEGLWHARDRLASWDRPIYQGLYIHATSKAHAEAQVSMVLPMMGCTPQNLRVSFFDVGTADEAATKNLESVNVRVKSAEARLRDAERRLEEAKNGLAQAQADRARDMGAVMLLGADLEDSETETDGEV